LFLGFLQQTIRLDLSPYEPLQRADEPLVIAVDSTGVRVHKAGGWVERRHGKKKRYIKVHFAVNVETREAVAMEVTTDDVQDSEVLRLLEEAESHGRVIKAYGDGAYGAGVVYKFSKSRGC